MALMGIDIGTSGCKASIVSLDGAIERQAYEEYPAISVHPGWQELDANTVWDSVRHVIAQAVSGYAGEDIKAIGVASFGEAITPVDRRGNVLCNSMLYTDCRGAEEAQRLVEKLGGKRILETTGASVHPMYSICKIMWLRRHRPDVYANTWKFLLFSDFVLYRLGAPPHTDFSLAARTLAFDVVRKEWSGLMLGAAEIDEGKFGKPVQAGTLVGHMPDALADELGLPRGVLLVAGGHDQPCAALGTGVIRQGMAVDGLGTTECITPAFDHPIRSQQMTDSGFACVPHVITDMYVTYAFTFTCGSLLRWYKDNFGLACRQQADRLGMNVYTYMIEQMSPDPSDVYVLPHFAGAATPYMDTQAKGAIIGMTTATTERDLLRSMLEGITFEIMMNVEKLEEAGIEVNDITAVGGLAQSDTYLQLKADMMGRKITALHTAEAGTLGVAILAGVAAGAYGSIEQAVKIHVRPRKVFIPDTVLHEQYREKFEVYKRIYPAVSRIYKC